MNINVLPFEQFCNQFSGSLPNLASEPFDLQPEWFCLVNRTATTAHSSTAVAFAEENGTLVFVLPLMIHLDSFFTRSVTGMTCFYTTLFRPYISGTISPAQLVLILKKIAKKTRADTFRLDVLDPEHLSFEALETAFKAAHMSPYRFFYTGNWFRPTEGVSWEEYLRSLAPKVRNTLKRLGRKFEQEADGKFEVFSTPGANLAAAIVDYTSVYESSWKVPEPFSDFVPGLIQLAAENRWLRLGIAYSNNKPVATQIWLVKNRKAFIYKVAYSEQFSHYSPGTLLTGKLLEHVLDTDKVSEIDFLLGDDSYKKLWMTDRRERWGMIAFNTTRPIGLLLAIISGLKVFARRVNLRSKRDEKKNH
jgi:CelD/BcsL family acetyltransferase involved in cellulose biosynthesis